MVLKSLVILGGVVALGGAAFVGVRHAREVRGDAPLGGAPHHAPRTAPAPDAGDGRAYMLSLQAEDYATYTHAGYGFSVRYPTDFVVLTDRWEEADVIDLSHPTLPLGIRISIHPFDPDGELVAQLAAMPDAYDLEAPDGAQSTALGWIDQDMPKPGEHRGVYWFVAHDHLFEIHMTAPDLEWLDAWMHEFASAAFTLTRPSSA